MNTSTLPRHPRTDLTALGWRKARPGESGPQPIWPVLGAAEEGETEETEEQETSEEVEETEEEGAGKGDEKLGAAGVQALKREQARRKDEAGKRRAAEARVAELEAEKTGKGAPTPEQIRAEADQAATARANQRIVRSEVRAAAAGKLQDPKDALTFIDLTQFEVDEDGQVDEGEVADAIDALLKSKPYLAAATAPRFQGGGDGGARKGSAGPVQFTEAQVKKMTPEQIDEARQKGQLRDYLGG